MIWTFAAAGTLGLAAVAGVQIGILKGVGYVIFYGRERMAEEYWEEFGRGSVEGLAGETVTRRAELAGSWQGWVFNALFTFVAAGFVEEVVKFLPVVYARHRDGKDRKKSKSRAYLDYVFAGALSFGVIESIAFLYTACEEGNESWSKLALTAFERIVLGQLGHLSVSALTALRATRSDYGKGEEEKMSWWQVIAPSVLLHGANNFAAMAASAVEGNVGWIHPVKVWNLLMLLGFNLGMNAVSARLVWKEWKAMGERERNCELSGDDEKKQ